MRNTKYFDPAAVICYAFLSLRYLNVAPARGPIRAAGINKEEV